MQGDKLPFLRGPGTSKRDCAPEFYITSPILHVEPIEPFYDANRKQAYSQLASVLVLVLKPSVNTLQAIF